MIVIRQHRIYRKDIQANPNVLYIFGDNLDRQGFGGQAAEMRGEPNSFGIATKRSITHNYPDDYFFDWQEDVLEILEHEFGILFEFVINSNYIKSGTGVKLIPNISDIKAIVIPLDGIGTGLSKLPENAPNALAYINLKLKELEDL